MINITGDCPGILWDIDWICWRIENGKTCIWRIIRGFPHVKEGIIQLIILVIVINFEISCGITFREDGALKKLFSVEMIVNNPRVVIVFVICVMIGIVLDTESKERSVFFCSFINVFILCVIDCMGMIWNCISWAWSLESSLWLLISWGLLVCMCLWCLKFIVPT